MLFGITVMHARLDFEKQNDLLCHPIKDIESETERIENVNEKLRL